MTQLASSKHVHGHFLCPDVVMQGSAVDPTGQYYYLVMASARPSFSLGGSTFTQVGSGTNMYLMKMSTADGSVLWARQYAASTGSVSDFFTAAVNFLDMDSAGNLYIGSFFTVGGCCCVTRQN